MTSTNDDKDREIERLRQEGLAKDKLIKEKDVKIQRLREIEVEINKRIGCAKNIYLVSYLSLFCVKRLVYCGCLNPYKFDFDYQLSFGF